MVRNDRKPDKLMLLVPVGGYPQPIMVSNINETLQCEMFACAFDEKWSEDVEVVLYVNDAGKIDGSVPNRTIRLENCQLLDVIFGDFLIAAVDRKTASTIDLPADAVRFYQQKYSEVKVNWEQRPQ